VERENSTGRYDSVLSHTSPRKDKGGKRIVPREKGARRMETTQNGFPSDKKKKIVGKTWQGKSRKAVRDLNKGVAVSSPQREKESAERGGSKRDKKICPDDTKGGTEKGGRQQKTNTIKQKQRRRSASLRERKTVRTSQQKAGHSQI